MSGETHCGHCAHHHELEVSGVTVRYRAHVALEDAGFDARPEAHPTGA